MLYRRIGALSFFVMTAVCAAAQTSNKFTITGCLTDSLSGSGDAYSTVRLVPQGKKQPVAAVAADVNGHFSISCSAAGKYTLEIIGLGRSSIKREVTLGTTEKVDLGTIYTYESSSTIGEATVVGVKPLVQSQIDRLSYSLADDPDAQSNTMLDMLRKVPLVTVDGEDNIKINGKSSFKVYVNGKPNKMMSDNPSIVLKSFPASVVKKVEVITDPGAKYDAEGVSGILNIVTATDAETGGWTLTPGIQVGNRQNGGNLFAMAQFGKFTISAHGAVQKQRETKIGYDTERETYDDAVNHHLTSKGEGRQHGTYGFGGLDASYEFTKHDLLSVGVNIFAGTTKNTNGTSNEMMGEAGKVYSYLSNSRSNMNFNDIDTNVDFQHNFDKEDQNLTFSYRFSNNLNKNNSFYNYTAIENVPFSLSDLDVDTDNKSREHTAQIDFTTPIGKHHTLSIGSKYILRINRSDNDEAARTAGTGNAFERDEDLSLLYRHRNGIASGYAEYIYKLNKFSLRSGLRFESSHIRVTYPDGRREAFSTTLNDWIPSLNLAYNITPTQMLRATYNMRIGRPDIDYLSPYVNHTNPASITYGDPNLTSERAHNVALNYSYFSQKFNMNVSANYATSTNGLTNYTFLRDGVLHTTSGNFLHSKSFSVDAFFNWAMTKTTNFTLNGTLSYNDYKSYRTDDHTYGFGGNFFAFLRQSLPWKLKFNIGGGNHWSEQTLQGTSTSFYFYFGSLSRAFLAEDRLSINISTFCPFSSNRTLTTTTSTARYRNDQNISIHGLARIQLGISWRLGKLKAQVKKVARSIENDDVKSGGNSNQQGQGSSMGTSTTGGQM